MLSRKIRVRGRVQGVGFRAALAQEARRLGVNGWVRNRVDGSVEALLQGPQQAADALLEWVRRGPPGAVVAELDVDDADEPAHSRFEMRATS